VKLAARQRLDEWIKSPQIAARIQTTIDRGEIERQIGPHVTISRETGAGGGQLGEKLAERLGWEVLDRQMLDYMAERFDRPRHMVDVVDETAAHWVHDVLRCWFDPKLVTHQKYVANLGKFVTLAACHGKVVFVGRGAQFILPPGRGVAIRVVAPRRYRVAETARLREISPNEADQIVTQLDQGRSDFIRRHFHHDPADPHLYDLVVNTQSVGLDAAVDLIEQLCHKRFD
jgi:cytidylate kinase